MTLQELLDSLDVVKKSGDLQSEVIAITEDSRAVRAGSVFVAIQGVQQDGHLFVSQAFAQGAVAVVVEEGCFPTALADASPAGAAVIGVKNSRKALGLMAAQLYGNPSQHLKMIGVTGTNGKTTVTYLAKSLLETHDHQVGLLGTVGYVYGNQRREASHTTPAPVQLQEMLGEMVRGGTDVGVLEVSSHALELDRVAGCEFDIVVFTNLTQDHLDFHQTMERYFQAKLHLFTDYVTNGHKPGPKR
ncbi:MAG: Mur ligase family protein, partial [Nitrospirota bacterium]|nr:Mur ligase family protein [Nitrospirota bacterium]